MRDPPSLVIGANEHDQGAKYRYGGWRVECDRRGVNGECVLWCDELGVAEPRPPRSVNECLTRRGAGRAVVFIDRSGLVYARHGPVAHRYPVSPTIHPAHAGEERQV